MRSLYKIGAAASTLIFIVLIGTLAYHNLEGWGYTDSFYFSSITVMTIGYGDFHPTHQISKIFTVFYAIAGVGVGLVTLTFIGQHIVDSRASARKHISLGINSAVRYHKKLGDGRRKKARRLARSKNPYGRVS